MPVVRGVRPHQHPAACLALLSGEGAHGFEGVADQPLGAEDVEVELVAEPVGVDLVDRAGGDAADQVLRARVRMLAGRVGGSDSRLDDDMVTALLDTAVGAQARHMLTHTIVGDATQVAEGLRQFASLAQADEVMLTNPAPALDLRLRTLEILADIHTDGD